MNYSKHILPRALTNASPTAATKVFEWGGSEEKLVSELEMESVGQKARQWSLFRVKLLAAQGPVSGKRTPVE